ncbi:hypothetical protein H312_00101 [Anncaliia algerae PRA339]|uniref:Transmembrane protein 138 n=1 Tax=Anncaliia algerae PRA339 TaxID=1288291 RepID=A0A059F574_9MICR|nr:hypothetical protein H312_00101 [Anncaliia algerae PRA339]
MISFRALTYLFFLYQAVIRFTHGVSFIIKITDYPLWLYIMPFADLLVIFYEKEENIILKFISILVILFTLTYITIHYIIYFRFITGMVRIMVISDIARFFLYLCYSVVDGYFYKSGLKKYYQAKR